MRGGSTAFETYTSLLEEGLPFFDWFVPECSAILERVWFVMHRACLDQVVIRECVGFG